jgi:hypothetical protein
MWLRVSLVVAAAAVTAILFLPASGPAATPGSYPSCGTYRNHNLPGTSAAQGRVEACIVKASREGRRARAVAVLTTIEGDPIATYFFVGGRRDVLVVVDTTRDAFGPREWQRSRCTRLTLEGGYLGWAGCVELGEGKPPWLKPVKLG